MRFCCCIYRSSEEKAKQKQEKEKQEHERELLQIRDHPIRQRRRSSVTPQVQTIGEVPGLEELCLKTNIEPAKDAIFGGI